MQDSYNLGWKVGLVAKGLANPAILSTYEAERRLVAGQLIEFDHKFSRLFSGRPAKDAADEAGISMEEFKAVFVKGERCKSYTLDFLTRFLSGAMFASGLSVKYATNILVVAQSSSAPDGVNGSKKIAEDGETEKKAASTINLGMRFPSAQVLNQASARPLPFAHLLRSDGRFRIILFAGDLQKTQQLDRVRRLCTTLDLPSSFLRRLTPRGARIDSRIELLTIRSGPRTAIELLELPEILHPFDEKTGWDYDKVFVDDLSYHVGHGHAYQQYGVDTEQGCMVVLRPDQHVAMICDLEEVESVDRYFTEVLLRPE